MIAPASACHGCASPLSRVGRARVQARQLVARPDHVLDALEDRRHRHHLDEERALVAQVGEAPRARFGTELGAGVVAFLGPQRLAAVAQRVHERRRHEAGQGEVAEVVELSLVGGREHGISGAGLFPCGSNGTNRAGCCAATPSTRAPGGTGWIRYASNHASKRRGSQRWCPGNAPLTNPACPPCGGCSSRTAGATSSARGSEARGDERIVARVDDQRRHGDSREPGLRRRARPVVVGAGESVQRRGDEVVERAHRVRAREQVQVDPPGMPRFHRARLRLQVAQEVMGVHAIEPLRDREARGHEVERGRHRGRARHGYARRRAVAPEPVEQRGAAERHAGDVDRRVRAPRAARPRPSSRRPPRGRRSGRRAASGSRGRRSRGNAGPRRASRGARPRPSARRRSASANCPRVRGTARRAAHRAPPARRASRRPSDRRPAWPRPRAGSARADAARTPPRSSAHARRAATRASGSHPRSPPSRIHASFARFQNGGVRRNVAPGAVDRRHQRRRAGRRPRRHRDGRGSGRSGDPGATRGATAASLNWPEHAAGGRRAPAGRRARACAGKSGAKNSVA